VGFAVGAQALCTRLLTWFFFLPTKQRDFFELVKNIGEAKSKQEEDILMRHECKKLQDELKEPDSKKLKEYLIRLMYCEMFGFKSEFGYIHAINLTQGQDLVAKRVGYLACCTVSCL
jgi:AP-4 complex subunit epsilon-1